MTGSVRGGGRSWSVRPALLLLGACGLASAFPGALALTPAGLEAGELWRPWTGHLVHLSPAHFLFDVGAAVLLVAVGGATRFLLAAPPVIGLAVLAARPDLSSYTGLSGVLHGLTVLVALRLSCGAAGWARGLFLTVALATLLKAGLETALGLPLLTGGIEMGAPTALVAHLVGGSAGALGFVVDRLMEATGEGPSARRPASRGAARSSSTTPTHPTSSPSS